jgi:hypothetical protein
MHGGVQGPLRGRQVGELPASINREGADIRRILDNCLQSSDWASTRTFSWLCSHVILCQHSQPCRVPVPCTLQSLTKFIKKHAKLPYTLPKKSGGEDAESKSDKDEL